jgi:alpha-beta hydrolase superfamily lysophospholipase
MGGKDKNIVLYGASRGASVIVNFMARSQLNSVKALVLESPLDSVQNHVGEILGKLNYVPCLNWFCHHFIVPGVYRKYNPRGVQPLDVVDKIQSDVPVLFVCSKTEFFYPATVRLYKKLARARRAQGQNNVHLLVLESGEHCGLLYDRHCGELYRDVVYAFYDKYGLKKPQISVYYPEGMRRGKQIFEAMSQPDPDTLPF